MDWGEMSRFSVGTVVLLLITAGLAVGAGTTTVTVQPDSAAVSPGETTTVDIVVDSVDDGVGSMDLELSVADSSVADITNVDVVGNPETVQTSGGNDTARIAATGMDTANTGSVTVATVTLEGESAGTSSLDLTVAAVGNESGSAYDVTATTDGQLTVEGAADDGDSDDNGPTAVAYGPRDTTVGTPVTFNASNSTSETADGIESYEWTFGDGTSANGRVVNYSYDDPGTYRVTLRVSDSNGFERDTTGIIVDAAPDDSQDDSDDLNSDTDETTDDTNTTDAGTGDDTGNESTSDDDTDEAETPAPETVTPTTTVEPTPSSPGTTPGGSTESPSVTATTTDTTATEPSSLQLVPLAVVGGLVVLVVGLIYYRRE